MAATTIGLALELILQLLAKSQAISAIVAAAQGQGRDLTPAEWAQITAADDAARQALVDAIAKAKGAPPPV